MGISERGKDKIEDTSAAFAEAAVAAIPLLGGSLAVLVNRSFGSAENRRRDDQIKELRHDLDGLRMPTAPLGFTPQPDPDFAGRDDCLEAISQAFEGSGPWKPVVIHGQEGVGRRSVALEFAARSGFRVLRFDGSTRGSLASSLAATLGESISEQFIGGSDVSLEAPGVNLFLIDGVTELGLLARLHVGPNTKLIVTSTTQEIGIQSFNLEVLPWNEQEVHDYMGKVLPGTPREDSAKLLTLLQGNTQIMCQAASTCSVLNVPLVTWMSYFEESPIKMLDTGLSATSSGTTFRALNAALERLMDRSPDAACLFRLLCVLGPGTVSMATVQKLARIEILIPLDGSAYLRNFGGSDPAREMALKFSKSSSLASAVHALVSCGHVRKIGPDLVIDTLRATIAMAGVDNVRPYFEVATSIMPKSGLDLSLDVRALPAFVNLVQHAREAGVQGPGLSAIKLLNAPLLVAYGMDEEAELVVGECERWLDDLETELTWEDRNLRGFQWWFSLALASVGRREEAARLLCRVTDYVDPGEEGLRDYSRCIRDLAALVSRRMPEQVTHALAALNYLASLNSHDPQIRINVELAKIWLGWLQGDVPSALASIDHAFEIVGLLSPEERLAEEAALRRLAAVFDSDMHDDHYIKEVIAGASSIDSDRYRASTPDVLGWLQLADAHIASDLESAKQLIRIAGNVIYALHPNSLRLSTEYRATHGRAALHSAEALAVGNAEEDEILDMLREAAKNLEEAVKGFRELPQSQSQNLPSSLINLAMTLTYQFKFDRALKLAEEALQIDLEKWGESHPEVLRDQECISTIEQFRRDNHHDRMA